MSKAQGTEPDADGGPPRPRPGMLGFYITAIALLLALAGVCVGWPRISAWRTERRIAQSFINALDKRVNMELTESADEALTYFRGVTNAGMVVNGEGLGPWNKRVTLKFVNTPLAVVLDSWCAQVGADWTVAEVSFGPNTDPMFKVFIAAPARVKDLEARSPTAARMIRRYRERLARERAAAER